MSAQPVDGEELTGPRFTVAYRRHGRDHVFDLDEVPDEELPERVRRWRAARDYAVVEDVRFMADTGESLAGVAARLTALRGRHISRDGVERFLYRYGAGDLVWRLKAAEVGAPEPDSPRWWEDVCPAASSGPLTRWPRRGQPLRGVTL